MKKIFFIIILCIIFMPLAQIAQAAFSDVTSDNLNYEAVEYVQSEGIVRGYEDGTFKLYNKINRAEFTKIVIGSKFGQNEIENCVPNKIFPDVPIDQWFYPYICIAINNGIIQGYSGNTFKPENFINFAEAATIIVKAFGFETNASELWYQPFVEKLEQEKAIPESIYSFGKSITRGEMAEMIYRLKEGIKDKPSMQFFTGDSKLLGSASFIKRYQIKDLSAANGIRQTKDGGYIFTGQTITDKPHNSPPMTDEDAFISKIDANGDHQWTKLFQSFHSVKIEKSIPGSLKKGEEVGRDIIELKDGSYLAASQGAGFIDNEYLRYKEDWDDIFLTKFDEHGGHLWTKMVGDYAGDYVYKLYATEDNGFLLSGFLTETGFGGAPKSPTYFILAKFNKNGEKKWLKKVNITDFDIKPLADGGFIALGNIKTMGRENGPEEKFAGSTMPVLIKFNPGFEVEWAKSFETIPLEEPIYKITEEGHTYLAYYRITRISAGNFVAVHKTSGGYLALGFLSPSTIGTKGSDFVPEGDFPLVAVKINNSGDLEWAKTIKLGMRLENTKKTKIIKTKDDGFVFKMDYFPPDRSDQENKSEIVQKKLKQFNDLCKSKNRGTDCQAGEINDDPELLQAWEEYAKTAKSFKSSFNNSLLLLKTDADFNPQWSKTIELEYEPAYGNGSIYGYGMESTLDHGLIIAGRYDTPILNYEDSSGLHFFQDVLLIKLDVNGQAINDEGMISDYIDLSLEDLSSYITLKDFPPVVEGLDFKIDKQVQPKTTSNETKVIDLCSTAVELAKPTSSTFLPEISSSQTSPRTKTWVEINYEKEENIEYIKQVHKEAREIHEELLPILNEIFADEVKLKDVFGGLDYIFSRLPTEDDKTAVQNYLEGLGYKIYLAEGDQLMVGKIGRTLTLSFSFINKMKGTLFVSW